MAIDLDFALREKIVAIQAQIAYPGFKLVDFENLHITLKFLGEVDDQQVSEICQKLHSVRIQPFEMEFKGVGVFPNPSYTRVVWIGISSSELVQLARLVNDKLVGYRDGDHGFSAHLTIARVNARVSGLAEKLQKFDGMEIGKQMGRDFRLKKSVLTPKGPIYSDIEIFELKA